MTSAERKIGLGMSVAAGLLFAMTTLWVSVRPREKPPETTRESRPAGSGRRTEVALELGIVHANAGCVGKPCRQDTDWSIRLNGRPVVDRNELRSALRREADRRVVIRGSETAPWGLVQGFMVECAKVGIYKIDWSLLEGGPLLSARLPARPKVLPPGTIILEEMRVFMKWDPASGKTLRKVGNRGMVDSDKDLMSIILQMANDYAKAGRSGIPIVIDATPDVPWKDVIHVLELCRKEKLEPIEFAAPIEKE